MGHQSSSDLACWPWQAARSSSPMCRSSSSSKGRLREEVWGLVSSKGSSKDWDTWPDSTHHIWVMDVDLKGGLQAGRSASSRVNGIEAASKDCDTCLGSTRAPWSMAEWS